MYSKKTHSCKHTIVINYSAVEGNKDKSGQKKGSVESHLKKCKFAYYNYIYVCSLLYAVLTSRKSITLKKTLQVKIKSRLIFYQVDSQFHVALSL